MVLLTLPAKGKERAQMWEEIMEILVCFVVVELQLITCREWNV